VISCWTPWSRIELGKVVVIEEGEVVGEDISKLIWERMQSETKEETSLH
jgi:hypothetical protein